MHDMAQSRKRASIHGCGSDCVWKQFRKNNWQLGKAISLSIHTPFLSPFRSLIYTKSTISRHSLHDALLQSHSFTTLFHSFVYKPRHNYFVETAPKAQECWYICGPIVGVSVSMGYQCRYWRAECNPRYRYRLFLSVRLGFEGALILPKSSNKVP